MEESTRRSEKLSDSPHSASVEVATVQVFKLSKRRWVILFGACVLGYFMGMVRDMSSILSVIIDLLDLKLERYVDLSQLFNSAGPVVALPLSYFLDRYGLRVFSYACMLLVAVQNGCRALLFWPETWQHEQLRFIYWIVSNITGSIVFVGYYCLPLKVAESWFPQEERSLAWALANMAPLVGSAMGSLLLSHIVPDKAHSHPVSYINLIAIVATLLAIIFCMTKSAPKQAPSDRRKVASGADKQRISENGRKLLQNRGILLLMIVWSYFGSMADLIVGILQDILGASGLSRVFAGELIAAMTLISAFSQLSGGCLLDRAMKRRARRTNQLEAKISSKECKISICMQCIAFIVYTTALCLRDSPQRQWWIDILVAVLWTVVRGLASPMFNSVAAQLLSGSVTEAFYCAVWIIIYCILIYGNSIIFVQLRYVDSEGRADYSMSMLFAVIGAILATFAFLTFFRVPDTNERLAPESVRSKKTGNDKTPGDELVAQITQAA